MNRDEQIREVKSATLLRFNQVWQRNFLSNRDAIQKNPGVIRLKNKFRDIPTRLEACMFQSSIIPTLII